MPLDNEQNDKALAWLKERLKGPCPSCQSSKGFELLDEFIVSPTYRRGGIDWDKNMPMVGLICNNCFNIRYFSAVLIGALVRTKENMPID